MEQMLAVIPRFFAGEGDWGNDYSKAAIFKFKVGGGNLQDLKQHWVRMRTVELQGNSAIFLTRQILYDSPA